MINLEQSFFLNYLGEMDRQKDVYFKFIVVGAGGNGGYLLPNLARQVGLSNKKRKLENRNLDSILVIDRDKVEPKNLIRQNFIDRDINKNKAEVLSQRYSRAFDTDISYLPEYIEHPFQLLHIMKTFGGERNRDSFIPVLIGTVDNNKTRKIMYDAFKMYDRSAFLIDAGNEEYVGQVSIGFKSNKNSHLVDNTYIEKYNVSLEKAKKYNDLYKDPDHRLYESYLEHVSDNPNLKAFHYGLRTTLPSPFYVPPVHLIHNEILEANDRLPHELSCAENAESSPQHVVTNQTVGNLLSAIVTDIVSRNPIDYHMIYFDAERMTFRTVKNTISVFKRYYEQQHISDSLSDYELATGNNLYAFDYDRYIKSDKEEPFLYDATKPLQSEDVLSKIEDLSKEHQDDYNQLLANTPFLGHKEVPNDLPF